ncbi:hypothetical protein [Streptomyces sp.]|uniref:hypothetical protein n=1 Tax=Streptomyces sp. TaxID=1931 RepID=UPI002F40A35A
MTGLSRDAEVIDRLPCTLLPVVRWLGPREERAVTVRLDGREQHALAVEEYDYGDRTAYRIRLRDDRTIRVWWDDGAMRWGWLPPGRDARPAGHWPEPKAVRRRWWPEREGWPALWVHTGGRWREAWLWGREDWPDGTVVYEVGMTPAGAQLGEGLRRHRRVYDPRSVQPRRYGAREDGSPA